MVQELGPASKGGWDGTVLPPCEGEHFAVPPVSLEKVQGGELPWCADGVPQGAGRGGLLSTYESSAVEHLQKRGRCINFRTWLTKMLDYVRSCWATLLQRASVGFVLLLSG